MNKKLFKCFFAIIFTILFENKCLYAAAVSFNQRAVFNDNGSIWSYIWYRV